MKYLMPVLLVSIFMISCSGSGMTDAELAQAGKDAHESLIRDSLSKMWTYHTSFDKMNEDSVYFAAVTSQNVLNFKSPYNGGSTVQLNVRRGPEIDVYISVSSGMFVIDSNGPTIRAKFDHNAPTSYEISRSSDNSSDMFFIRDGKAFLRQLRKHKRLILETEFYQEGVRQIEFNIENLKWKD